MTTEVSNIPFNLPHLTGKELANISEAHSLGSLAGDGSFTKLCHRWLEETTGCSKALLTHSCTSALDMTALLLDIKPGDEIIMPSYTFVSTANAFVLRGGVPVFVDIREDTLNIDEMLIEAAITKRTRAIVPVHYAGVACEMDTIMSIAKKYGLHVVEDAAQGVMSTYKGKPLGSIGDFGTYSFHETKNIISGEGGALLINRPSMVQRAEIIREKGTDRSVFLKGEIDKYTWQDVGSSFLPGELIAAFLWAQLSEANRITRSRLQLWEHYHLLLEPLENEGLIRRPIVPNEVEHNGHIYYILLSEEFQRDIVLSRLVNSGVKAVFHYVPLHSSSGGLKFCVTERSLKVTERQSQRIIRLPLWIDMTLQQQVFVVSSLTKILKN